VNINFTTQQSILDIKQLINQVIINISFNRVFVLFCVITVHLERNNKYSYCISSFQICFPKAWFLKFFL